MRKKEQMKERKKEKQAHTHAFENLIIFRSNLKWQISIDIRRVSISLLNDRGIKYLCN